MAKNVKQPVDFAVLGRGLLQDLADAVGVEIPAEKRGDSGTAAIQKLAASHEEIMAAPLRSVAERYGKRVADLEAVLVQRRQRLEAYAVRERRGIASVKNKFIVAGRVVDSTTGQGLPNVRIRATDLDRKQHDLLGETHTDALGYYRIEYRREDFAESGEGMPETFIEVLDGAGKALYTSPKSFVVKAGKVEFISAAVDGQKLPISRRMGEGIQFTVAKRLERLDRDARVLAKPLGSALDKLSRNAFTGGNDPRVHSEEPSPSQSVTILTGIGRAGEKKLAGHGVHDVLKVSAMSKEELRQVLGVSEKKAQAILSEAKRHKRRGATKTR